VAIVAVGSVLYLLEPVAVMGAERLNVILRKNAFRRKLVDASVSCCIRRSPVTMDVMFELFDNELLITDDAVHHIANRNYAN
jgi:hypothetical protein